MRILFLTASYPLPEHPGAGIFVREHARAVARNAEVAIAHIDRNDDVRTLHVETADDADFHAVRVRYPAAPLPVSYAANVAAASIAYRRLRRGGFVPDVIHAHFFLAGAPAVVLGRALRKPVVVTEQWSVFLPEDPMTLSPLMQRIARFTYEHADVVMPVSAALRDGIRSIGTAASLRIVPNVIDAELFHPGEVGAMQADGPRTLIGVGGLYDAKGWDRLLEALALLAPRHDVRLELFGDGVLRAQLEELAQRLGIAPIVDFHGWHPKDVVARRVRESDLFVMTSVYDSNPCALMEALASGVPVVATPVGGIPEMVTDGLGVLTRSRSAEDIAAAVEAALDPAVPWDRARIAQTARDRYGADTVGASFASVYDAVLARRR